MNFCFGLVADLIGLLSGTVERVLDALYRLVDVATPGHAASGGIRFGSENPTLAVVVLVAFLDGAADRPTQRRARHDDADSIGEKAEYVQWNGFNGMMVWELSADKNEVLLDSIREEFEGPPFGRAVGYYRRDDEGYRREG